MGRSESQGSRLCYLQSYDTLRQSGYQFLVDRSRMRIADRCRRRALARHRSRPAVTPQAIIPLRKSPVTRSPLRRIREDLLILVSPNFIFVCSGGNIASRTSSFLSTRLNSSTRLRQISTSAMSPCKEQLLQIRKLQTQVVTIFHS